MKLKSAHIAFEGASVIFGVSEEGRVEELLVNLDGEEHIFDASKHCWRCCVTHAGDAVRMARRLKAHGNFARERAKGAKRKFRTLA